MTHPYWPMTDVRLSEGDLELRPMTEADLPALADAFPADVEQDPASPPIPGLDPAVARGTVQHQTYWRYLGAWSPAAWRLNFCVHESGVLVGVQELEGNDFPVLRTVDSSSYLVAGARGRGLGKRMRRAVLALAFGPLEAQAAITSAWQDNQASLGVSRALGYLPNGESLEVRGEGADVMVHLRLTRADWLAGGGHAGPDVAITGFDPCRPFFGL